MDSSIFCIYIFSSRGVNTIKPFLNKLPILETETLSSYIYRIFKHNHQDTPYAITNKSSFKRFDLDNNQIREEICKELSSLTGKDNLYKYSYRAMNLTPVQENFLTLKTWTKCCTSCMEEQIHQGFSWGFHIVNVCTRHSVYLLNECSRCSKRFTINSLFENECGGCKQTISEMHSRTVTDDFILESQKEITELLQGSKKKFLGLLDINDLIIVLSGFSQIFHGLNSFTQNNVPEYKMEYTNKIPFCQKDLINYLADLHWLFKDFDNRFPLILQATFLQDAVRNTRRRRQTFEKSISSSSNLDFIVKAYHDYRLENYIRVMKVPKNIKSFDKQASEFIEKEFLTMDQIKSKFNIVDSELDFLMKTNFLAECHFYNGTTTYFFKNMTEKLLQEFLKERADKVTAVEAAKILGIHVDRVFDLLQSEVLRYSPFLENDKTLSKKQIMKMLRSLNAKKINEVEEKLTLSQCFNKYSTSGLSLSQLIIFIRSSGLTAFTMATPYKMCDLFFDPDDLANKIKEHRVFTKGYNLKQVSQELGCSEQTVLKIVQAGLLDKPVLEILNKNAFAYRFEVKDIEVFKKTFYSLDQIVKEYGVTPSLVRSAIFRGVIKNYLSGICRKILVDKQQFENYRNRSKVH